MSLIISQSYCKNCGDLIYNKNGDVYVICDTCFEVNSIMEMKMNFVIYQNLICSRFMWDHRCIKMNTLRSAYQEKLLYDKAIEEYVQEVSP